jgi:hypothetical protein
MAEELRGPTAPPAPPADPDVTGPPSIGALRDQAVAAHKQSLSELTAARAERDKINKRIAALVKSEAELRRFVSASTPRKPRTPKAKG